ncbi:MT-A70 family methyltransferase [Phreatobacter sp. HK31-P]
MSDHETMTGVERGQARAILIDPPWFMSGGTKHRPQHYPRLRDSELVKMPIRELAHPEGAWLFMWATPPKLHHAIRLGEKLGFKYSSRAFVWIKTHRRLNGLQSAMFVHPDSLHRGQGYTTRKNAEDVLLFRIGKPMRQAKDVFEVILSPPREHSRKPRETQDRIERFCAGPYLEIFSREPRHGWASWGNETDKFAGDTHALAA